MSFIRIVLQKSRDDLIVGLSSTGHALRGSGTSLACGLVSSSLRSFARVLSEAKDFPVQLKLSGPGHFELRVGSLQPEFKDWYRGLCELLYRFLQDAQVDFPDQIKIELQTLKQEI